MWINQIEKMEKKAWFTIFPFTLKVLIESLTSIDVREVKLPSFTFTLMKSYAKCLYLFLVIKNTSKRMSKNKQLLVVNTMDQVTKTMKIVASIGLGLLIGVDFYTSIFN